MAKRFSMPVVTPEANANAVMIARIEMALDKLSSEVKRLNRKTGAVRNALNRLKRLGKS